MRTHEVNALQLMAVGICSAQLATYQSHVTERDSADTNLAELDSIDDGGIFVRATQWSAIGTQAIDVQAIELQAIELQAIELQAIDLQAIHAKAIGPDHTVP